MRIGLGTAQFGMSYGISNRKGKISATEARAILAAAGANGVEVIDTAAAYGDSEIAIRNALPAGHCFRIVTKLPSSRRTPDDAGAPTDARSALQRSLRNLGQPRVYGFLVHDVRDLLTADGHALVETLRRLKQEGLVEKVGVSVYTPTDIDRVLELFVPDIVQAPVSIFDQRLLASGHLAQLKYRGVEIHARSVFLQGLLLMDADAVPAFCAPVAERFRRYGRFLEEAGLTRLQAALAFVGQLEEVDVALVGVSGLQDLEDIFRALGRNAGDRVRIPDPARWSIADERIVNPGLWPRQETGRA